MRSHLPRWYNDFSFHDSKIINVEEFENSIVLNLEFDDFIHTKYQLKLFNPKIIEYCKLKNSWWLFDEMYINENCFEFHIMVSDFDDNSIISYFTVKCSDILLIFMGKTYSTKTPYDITVTYDYDILPETIEDDFFDETKGRTSLLRFAGYCKIHLIDFLKSKTKGKKPIHILDFYTLGQIIVFDR